MRGFAVHAPTQSARPRTCYFSRHARRVQAVASKRVAASRRRDPDGGGELAAADNRGLDLPPTHKEQEDQLEGDMMGVTVHRLSNGLTVYISTNRQKPRFERVDRGADRQPQRPGGLDGARALPEAYAVQGHQSGLAPSTSRPEAACGPERRAIQAAARDRRRPGGAQAISPSWTRSIASSKHSVPNEMSRSTAASTSRG